MLKDKNIKRILLIFLLSRLPILIIIAYQYINKGSVEVLRYYDCDNYLKIAEFGYNTLSLYAFFPLYPLLMKILNYIIPSFTIVGFLISNISFLLSLLLLNKLLGDKKDKLFYILCFIFSPILIYSSVIYTESLFIMLTLLSYYLYKKDKLYLSALTIGLSILTRNTGIILLGAIGLDLLIRLYKKDKLINLKKIIIFSLISLSIGCLYPLYLYIKVGDPLYFIHVQDIYWYRTNSFIFKAFIDDISIAKKFNYYYLVFVPFLENWLSYFLSIIIGIKLFKKDKLLSIYVLCSLIVFSVSFRDIKIWKSSLASISMFRYIWGLFPLYIGLLPNKKKIIKLIIFIIIGAISLLNYYLYCKGYFIA